MTYDKIIIGAGIYGLYSALQCGQRGQKILVLERDPAPFMRATYINQARVHMGYHYPRSYSTAIKSARYFKRFCQDYQFCLHTDFDQIYATSSQLSWTNAEEFQKFCQAVDIRCVRISPEQYFQPGMCDGAFLTTEYTYDAQVLKQWFLEKLSALPNVTILYCHKPEKIRKAGGWIWNVKAGEVTAEAPFILNTSYASVNELHHIAGFPMFPIKYEKCEIILCKVNDQLRSTGLTVMDGPFLSLMPFGRTGFHSLTSVTFTPHETSYDAMPAFSCQEENGVICGPGNLCNCNECPARPESAWQYMSQLAKKYLREDLEFIYYKSLFSIKPILTASEIDDSRPTVVKKMCDAPIWVSVLSGKINTIYDLDEVLENE